MNFTIYGKQDCGYCQHSKDLLTRTGHEYSEIRVPDEASRDEIQLRVNESGSDTQVRTVPQIFHGDRYVGGFKELVEYLRGI